MAICQYAGCMEEIGGNGVTVSLKLQTKEYDEKRAVFCCAAHAAFALLKLANDRREPEWTGAIPTLPKFWRQK